MRRLGDEDLIPLDWKIEKTLKIIRKGKREATNMEQQPLEHIQENNLELKSITLQLLQGIQFHGLAHEDPNDHILNFLEVCDTVKYNGVSDKAIRLRLFTFSLKEKAKH